jgi:hypothetical protein
MPESLADGVFLGRVFLAPAVFAKLLAAIDRLASSWASSEELGLLGRSHTSQVRPTDLAAQGPLDEIRLILAPAALQWAQRCGIVFPRPPHLQLFPVRMVGDAERPPYQEPHVDSTGAWPGPPICTNVFYAVARDVVGGELMVAGAKGPDGDDALAVRPAVNSLVTFRGDRVHWVRPLLAGERISVVVDLY